MDSNKNDILSRTRKIAKSHYNAENIERVESVKNDVVRLYSGKFDGYQKCDTLYHNLEHTIQVINPFVRIIDGWNKAGETPWISFKFFELGVIAVLLHDTGYIKKVGDNDGTGGKYTFTHIGRSIIFAEEYLFSRAFTDDDITAVCNMILCTGMVERIMDFSSDEEKICGYALGSADLIGQLSAHNYPEKLPYLYSEFKEAYEYEGIDKIKKKSAFIFDSAEALIQSTPVFYKNVVQKRLKEMGSLDKYIRRHRPEENENYKAAIKKNLFKLNSEIAANHSH